MKSYLHTYKLTYPDGKYRVEVYDGDYMSPKEAMEKMRISIRGLKAYKYSGVSSDSEKYKQWQQKKSAGYSNEKAWYEVFGSEKYKKGGGVKKTSLPKVGSEVRARWNDSMQWTIGTFKGETENGFEVYNYTIEEPQYIEYYGQISLDPYNGSEIFKSNKFKHRNYKYNFNKQDENYANGGNITFTYQIGGL